MTGTPVAKRLWRGGKRLLLGLVVLLLVYQLWLFGWVLWWGQVNPEHTRFMDIRLAELRSKDPAAQLKKQFVLLAWKSRLGQNQQRIKLGLGGADKLGLLHLSHKRQTLTKILAQRKPKHLFD